MALHSGVRHGGDSSRYLDGAQALLDGRPLEPVQRAYVGYIAVLAVAKAAGVGGGGVVVFQVLVAGLACLALFSLGAELGGFWSGLLSAALYAFDPDFTRILGWHSYILTDSLYTSMGVIAVWAVHRASVRRGWSYVPAALAVLATVSLRPTGLGLLVVAAVYWLLRARGRAAGERLRAAAASVVLAAGGAVGGLLGARRAADASRELRLGHVIWRQTAWSLSMPPHPRESGDWPMSPAMRSAIRLPPEGSG